MHVQVRLDGKNPRLWQLDLLRQLSALPNLTVSVNTAPTTEIWPASANLLFSFEALLQSIATVHSTRIKLSDLDSFQPNSRTLPKLVIDLCGDFMNTDTRIWQVTFCGAAGDCALLAVLLGGEAPFIQLTEGRQIIIAGRAGSERPDVISAAFDDALGRTKTLIISAIFKFARLASTPVPPDVFHPQPLTSLNFAKSAMKQLTWNLIRRLYSMCYYTPHWRTGWRRLDGPDLFDLRSLTQTAWHNLPDDSKRFYADPFPIMHQGKLYLFVEDFAHRMGKGVISVTEFGQHGPLHTPEPVLELPCHLSYPFVFECEGEMWMIPETSGARTVELYRARNFPNDWVREAILLSDLVAGDATLTKVDGTWWMFASVRGEGGAYSDVLSLWSAPNFRGPWTPHPNNPVLMDMASARPAGRIVERNGVLFRPVQDCRNGYGAALGIARILRLDEMGFQQIVETILTPGPAWPGRRLHTLNGAGGYEFIDGSGRARRW